MKALDVRAAVYRGPEGGNAFATFALKRDAIAFARRYGWRRDDVLEAANRFSAFWIIGQCQGDELVALDRDGAPKRFPWPGYA